jgi:hypothetical protein
MKTYQRHSIKYRWVLLGFLGLVSLLYGCPAVAQTIDAKYVHNLYAKYPTVKSNFCPACKLWVNPYFKSIADTQRHMPLITYEYYKANPKSIVKRTGVFSGWHSVIGQVNEDNAYTASNKAGKGEIAKGHCQAWILNSFCADAAILSDTYTFNAAMECQGQNVGTEIATENLTRKLLLTHDVQVWCGTFGSQGVLSGDCFPAYYWKVIKYGSTIQCYWMPNLQSEGQSKLVTCTYQQLIKNLGFDPIASLQ